MIEDGHGVEPRCLLRTGHYAAWFDRCARHLKIAFRMIRKPIPGLNAWSVLDLIAKRREGGPPDPGRRLGLVVEGGGMRGVYSSGSLLALQLAGCVHVFDDLFGTSA